MAAKMGVSVDYEIPRISAQWVQELATADIPDEPDGAANMNLFLDQLANMSDANLFGE